MQLVTPVATTLEAAHRHKIVHRDVKPSNVFVVDREHGGGVRLLDFGLANVFRTLGGRPPFRGKDLVELCRTVTTGARPSLVELRPGLPPAIDAWVKRALAIDPAARFASIREMWPSSAACSPFPTPRHSELQRS